MKDRTLLDRIARYLFNKPEHEKLVRDLIPKFSEEKKDGGVFRHPSGGLEVRQFLGLKLLEEAMEAIAEVDPPLNELPNRLKITEELGDLIDVIEAVANAAQIPMSDIHKRRALKAQHKGGFDDMWIWDMRTRGL